MKKSTLSYSWQPWKYWKTLLCTPWVHTSHTWSHIILVSFLWMKSCLFMFLLNHGPTVVQVSHDQQRSLRLDPLIGLMNFRSCYEPDSISKKVGLPLSIRSSTSGQGPSLLLWLQCLITAWHIAGRYSRLVIEQTIYIYHILSLNNKMFLKKQCLGQRRDIVQR